MRTFPAIEILEKGLVIPGEPTPAEDIWLSNLDLLATRPHTPTIYIYRRRLNDAGFFSPEALKASLARALVPFYPLAGRLVSGADGRLCIRCTAEGALFVVARSASAVEDFGDFAPSNEISRLLVPHSDGADDADTPLVMFQVSSPYGLCTDDSSFFFSGMRSIGPLENLGESALYVKMAIRMCNG